jgi:hypothetical protein
MNDTLLADLIERIRQTQEEWKVMWEHRVAREDPATAAERRRRRAEVKAEEAALRREYAPLFDQILALFGYHDPVRIAYPPEDMYVYIRQTKHLIAKLAVAQSRDEVVQLMYQEFTHAFGTEAGPESRYEQLSDDTWPLIQRFRGNAGATKGMAT